LTHIRKIIAVLLVLAFLVTFSLGAAGDAAATQNAPSWSTGNQWVLSATSGSTTTTETTTVKEQTSLTIGATTYQVWHVSMTATATSGSSSFSQTSDEWFTTDGFKLARTQASVFILGNTTSTNDPPYPVVVFPLNPGDSWVGSYQETTQSNLGTSTQTKTYSGSVTGEQSVTVPAGTFTAAVVRTPATGNPYTLSYYSEQVGWLVRIDTYNSGGSYESSMNLTSYSYSGYGLFGISSVIWISLLLLVLVIVVAAALVLRGRHPPTSYQAAPQAPYQRPYQQPPQQGPPGGSPPPPPRT
jgi:hypothetical protein